MVFLFLKILLKMVVFHKLGPLGRIIALGDLPVSTIYSNRWPWIMSTATDYVGMILFLGGLYGLWQQNKNLGQFSLLLSSYP